MTQMGGQNAKYEPHEAADGIVWLATAPVDDIGDTGQFWRHRKQIPYAEDGV